MRYKQDHVFAEYNYSVDQIKQTGFFVFFFNKRQQQKIR